MTDLMAQDVGVLAERFYAGDGSVDAEAVKYSRGEICDYLRYNVGEIAQIIEDMSPAQLAYRLPGAPEGVDSSGDEEHFDASQIVTHVASGMSFHRWGLARALGHERPSFPRPPEGVKSTGTAGKVMGAGGWAGASVSELLEVLNEAQTNFLEHVGGLPEELEKGKTSSLGMFRNLSAHGWIYVASIHVAMHLKQLQEMQAQPDYPA